MSKRQVRVRKLDNRVYINADDLLHWLELCAIEPIDTAEEMIDNTPTMPAGDKEGLRMQAKAARRRILGIKNQLEKVCAQADSDEVRADLIVLKKELEP